MKIIRFIVFSIVVFQSCKPPEKINSFEINLETGWMFRKLTDTVWFPAEVPGTVLHDLFKNKQIDDPRLRDNLNTISWVEKEDWEYKTEFDVPNEILLQDSVYLKFEDLFPLAAIILNDSVIYSAKGYYNAFSVSCKKQLKLKQNKLCIQFYSPYNTKRFNEKAKQELWSQNKAFIPSAFLNGTRVSPKLFNFGVLQPIKLVAWSDTRIKNLYVVTDSVNENTAFISFIVNVEAINPGNCDIVIEIKGQSGRLSSSTAVKNGIQKREIAVQINKPDLWWCNGLGRQPLYQANVSLVKEGFVISKRTVMFGVRKIELITQPDSTSYSFFFKLNNKPLFVKGANIIPSKIYRLDENADWYEQITDDAVAANINMFRIWGSEVYESPDFFELCHKKGILIWQEQVFDLKMYKSEADAQNEIVSSSLKLLQNIPSLALCNATVEYPAKDKISVKECNLRIANLLNNLTKDVSHIPLFIDTLSTSTVKRSKYSAGPDWTSWYEGEPLSNIQNKTFSFVNKFGAQSLPDMKTTSTFTDKDDYVLRSPILAAHQFDIAPSATAGLSGTPLLSNYIQMYYNEPNSFESFVYLSQVFQAHALKFAIEQYRIKQPYCMGTILWHYNDAWPSISWSVMDNYNRLKPAYYAVRDAYKNIIIVPERWNGKVRIWVVSDSVQSVSGIMEAHLTDFYGSKHYSFMDTIKVERNKPCLAFSEPERNFLSRDHTNKLLLYATFKVNNKLTAENIFYFCDPIFLDLPVPDVQLKVEDKGNGYLMKVSTNNLVKNLVFTTLHNDCKFSDNNLDILPGGTKIIFAEYNGTKQEFEGDLQMKSLIETY
jgi:beta-mannosidase